VTEPTAPEGPDAAAWQAQNERGSGRIPRPVAVSNPPGPPGFESRTPAPHGSDKPSTTTLPGAVIPPPRPSPPIPMQAMAPMAPMDRLGSEPGSRPLVDDPRLGFQSGPMMAPRMPDGGATRMPSPPVVTDLRVTSYRGWVMLLVLMAIGIAAGVVIAMNTGQ
jgi:hypothetical protein